MVNTRCTEQVHAQFALLVSIVQALLIHSLLVKRQLDFRYPVQLVCTHLRDQEPVRPVLMVSLVTSQVYSLPVNLVICVIGALSVLPILRDQEHVTPASTATLVLKLLVLMELTLLLHHHNVQ